MPFSLVNSKLSNSPAFIWRVGKGTFTKVVTQIDKTSRNRLVMGLAGPVGIAGGADLLASGIFTSASTGEAITKGLIGFAGILGWTNLWLQPFRGAPWQQFVPAWLNQQAKIMKACRTGNLTTLQHLSLPSLNQSLSSALTAKFSPFNFSFLGKKYNLPTRRFPRLTPLQTAIDHRHWEVAQWLLLKQNLMFSDQFLGVLVHSDLQKPLGLKPSATNHAFIHNLQDCLFLPSRLAGTYFVRETTLWEKYLTGASASQIAQLALAVIPKIGGENLGSFSSLFLVATLVKRAYLNASSTALTDLYQALKPHLAHPEALLQTASSYLQQSSTEEDKVKDLLFKIKTLVQRDQLVAGLFSDSSTPDRASSSLSSTSVVGSPRL